MINNSIKAFLNFPLFNGEIARTFRFSGGERPSAETGCHLAGLSDARYEAMKL